MRPIRGSLLLLTMSGAFALQAASFPPAVQAVRMALRMNDAEAAVEAADRAVAELPKSADAWHIAGGAYGRMAQTASVFSKLSWAGKCREAYQTAVALDPRHFQAQIDLLHYYLAAPGIAGGGRDKADEQAVAIARLDAGWGHRARAAIAGADKDEAAFDREARAAIAASPNEPRHRADFVMALTARERYADAFVVLDEALKQFPDEARLIYQTGRLAAVSGQQLERGLAALDQVRARSDKPDDYSEGGALWRRAQILEKLGRREQALSDFRRAGELEPALTKQVEQDIARLQKG